MYTGVIVILAPLLLGYLVPVTSPALRRWLNKSVGALVYVILALLGIGLGTLDDLAAQMARLSGQVLLLIFGLALANLAGLWLWANWRPLRLELIAQSGRVRNLRMLSDAVLTLGAVATGVAVGYFLGFGAEASAQWAEWALMLLLLAVGCQLRNAGIPLRRVLLNRQGLGIALTVVVSSLGAGLALIPFINLPWSDVLALTSGFGWYSLSAIVIGDALGPLWGGAAFLNDMGRELVALMVIPLLMQLRPAMAVGYGGATAMDFTLPVIQRSGGLAIVPVAMASGFILSLLSPLLMALFLAWPKG